MVQCRKCGKWFEPTTALTNLCHACQPTITVSAGTTPLLTPHDKLLALGWEFEDYDEQAFKHYSKYPCVISIDLVNKRYIMGYDKITPDMVDLCFVDLQLAKILVEYLEELG